MTNVDKGPFYPSILTTFIPIELQLFFPVNPDS